MSDQMRRRLELSAVENHRSLSGEITARLDESVSGSAFEELMTACRLPRFVRLPSSNTLADVRRICSIVQATEVDHVVLAAKADAMNAAVLVMTISTAERVFVVDDSMVNMARPPRETEVQDLMQTLDRRGVLENASYRAELVADTSGLSVEEAAASIAHSQEVAPLHDLADYLAVLSQHGIFDVEQFRAQAGR